MHVVSDYYAWWTMIYEIRKWRFRDAIGDWILFVDIWGIKVDSKITLHWCCRQHQLKFCCGKDGSRQDACLMVWCGYLPPLVVHNPLINILFFFALKLNHIATQKRGSFWVVKFRYSELSKFRYLNCGKYISIQISEFW